MFFKGDRVLYRNTHFGTIERDQSSPQSETVQVTLDKPYGSVGQTMRIDDLEAVRDADHERYLSLQINKIAPSRTEWKSGEGVMDDETAHKIIREMRDDVIASVVTLKHRLRQEQDEFNRDPSPDTAAIIRRLEQKIEDATKQGTALAIATAKF